MKPCKAKKAPPAADRKNKNGKQPAAAGKACPDACLPHGQGAGKPDPCHAALPEPGGSRVAKQPGREIRKQKKERMEENMIKCSEMNLKSGVQNAECTRETKGSTESRKHTGQDASGMMGADRVRAVRMNLGGMGDGMHRYVKRFGLISGPESCTAPLDDQVKCCVKMESRIRALQKDSARLEQLQKICRKADAMDESFDDIMTAFFGGDDSPFLPLTGVIDYNIKTNMVMGIFEGICPEEYVPDPCIPAPEGDRAGKTIRHGNAQETQEAGRKRDPGENADMQFTRETAKVLDSRDIRNLSDPGKAAAAMLADMESLMGMLYGAKQMIGLSGSGAMTPSQVDCTISLYCKQAREITEKWQGFRKR